MKMYFVKAKKHIEEQDANELQQKIRRDRYQRSDSARLVLQALPQAQQQTKQQIEDVKPTSAAETSKVSKAQTGVDSHADFKLEDLPDGACYRLKKDLRSLPVSVAVSSTSSSSSVTQDATSDDNKNKEYVRPAEYIGTFSVSGSDKEARERQMESQLEHMRNARERRPIKLIISNSGVKVVLLENNNVFMDHSLKRIWYATCDPEYCQFSFLAREPKTSADVQYCHAFVTRTPEQAEELISVIGDAFKSTYTEAKKQPTFHELIEQQVQQQQAKFREIEKEAKHALQKKLKEIATPTPFSERAQFRMEQRRKSDDAPPAGGSEKVWAKQQVEQYGVKHAVSPDRNNVNMAGKRRSEIPSRQISSPQPSSPLKRNSVPPQAALLSNPVPSSPLLYPLSALAIKESLETRSSNSKFKGSPVTALKNEIDRRLSMTNGEDENQPHHVIVDKDFRKEQGKPPKQNIMANRPLPLPPDLSMSPQQVRQLNRGHSPLRQSSPQQLQQLYHRQQSPLARLQQRSLDDHHLPRSTSSQVPLSSNDRNDVPNVKIRNSPTRRQTRPMSEIATSSSGAAGTGGRGGSSFYEHQRQSLLNNFAASFNLPPNAHDIAGGMYIYGPSLQDQEGDTEDEQVFNNPQQARGRNLTRRAGGKAGDVNSRGVDEAVYNPQMPDGNQMSESSQKQTHSRPSSTSGQGQCEMVVPRYQNDSPFQNDKSEKGLKHQSGLESLMYLDRSHIHDEALRNATWYQAGLPRECALEILQQEEVGSFIVRDSSTHPGCFALSVRVPKFENASGISHYLILRTHRGVKLKGLDKEWSTLTALVTHHTVMREMLPCTLRLPKVKVQGIQSSASEIHGGDGSSREVDGNMGSDNYNRLSDVTGLVKKMKI